MEAKTVTGVVKRRSLQFKIIRALLAGGADPEATMDGGWTAAAAADRDGAAPLLEVLGAHPAGA